MPCLIGPRIFRRALFLLPVALSALPVAVAGAAGGDTLDTLRLAVLLPADSASPRVAAASRGVTLGAEEAGRTAALFGRTAEILVEHVATDAATTNAAHRLLQRPVTALVGGVDETTCHALTRLAIERRVTFVGVLCAPDRDERVGHERVGDACRRFVFYVRPAESTSRRAREAYAARPTEASDGRPQELIVALWHHSLSRFGAAQLNERFRRRFGAEIDSDAWAGWIAVKSLVEASLRARSTATDSIARYLARPGSRFDGHKGEPLSFDARTGELRQPLYIVTGGAVGETGTQVIAELPAEKGYGPRHGPSGGVAACPPPVRGDDR